MARLPYQGHYDEREDIGKTAYNLLVKRRLTWQSMEWESLSEAQKFQWRDFAKAFSSKILATLPKQ